VIDSVPTIEFTVIGEAKPAGSKRAFRNPHSGRIIVTDANKGSKPWKQEVAAAAAAATDCATCGGEGETGKDWNAPPRRCPACNGTGKRDTELLTGPIALEITFVKPRPASHYGTGKNRGVLKASAPLYPATRPDALKLARGVEDALSGVLYRDDAQIVTEYLLKRYGEPARCEIRVWDLEAVQHDERTAA
jgi:Holliday junction resolvase RusA-like endonuclease